MNTQARVAREATKSLIALADVPNVVSYHGSAEDSGNGTTLVTVQPHYLYTKDWYKVSVRNSDCRVLGITLFAEDLPLQ
jgi:hypothetical protein